MAGGKGLQAALDKINKQYGASTVVKLSDKPAQDIEVISSGSLSLDIALGVGGFPKGRIVEIYGPESSGKAQPLTSQILTPSGWVTMGDVREGQIICTPGGELSSVIGLFPQGMQEVYRLTLDDKSVVECTLDHIWSVQTRDSDLSHIMTTQQLISAGLGKNHRKFKIPTIQPTHFHRQDITMDPYLLGLLLGDGALRDSVVLSSQDDEILESVRVILNRDYDMSLSTKRNNCDYGFKKNIHGSGKNGVVLDLIELDLYNKRSECKHIPKNYLLSDVDTRISLFQGLIDSDGHINPNQHSIQYVTTSKQLADDFVFLSRSLGMRCVMSDRINSYTAESGNKVSGQRAYYINCLHGEFFFQPARLTRKQMLTANRSSHNSRYIESIVFDRLEECQCIMIAHPDSLYITDNFTTTHNTTVTLHAIAEAQKKGGIAAFIDAEHAFDRKYAESIGVDVESLYFVQPDNGEQAMDICRTLASSGEVDLIIIDSVAALTPKAELEGDIGDSKMGLHARLMSQSLRMITGEAHKSNCTIIFINQLREKIGVMFGCFDYDTRVVLSDGSTRKIGEIVNSNETGLLVKTFDSNGICIDKPIVTVFKNSQERVDGFLSFTVAKGRDNGRCQFRATPNHLISTPTGDQPAEFLKEGDEVLVLQEKILDDQSFQILLGGLYGDNHLKVKSKGYFNSIQNHHGPKQVEYCKWKAHTLGSIVTAYNPTHNSWRTKPLLEFDGFNQRSVQWIDRLELLGLAIMYMDDGSFHVDRCFIYKQWSQSEIEMLHNRIETLTGARGSVSEKYGRITYCTTQMRKFQDAIAMYIVPSMRYKLYDSCPFDFESLSPYQDQKTEILYPMPILKIEESTRKSIKFDLEIQDTHHYLVDGVMVHNSPETTTGGNALKFYASVRLDVRRTGSSKASDGSIVSNETKVTVKKNKVAPPFEIANFSIVFGQGISRSMEVLEIGTEVGVIDRAGSWFSYQGEKIGQGKDAARLTLQDNPDLQSIIELHIMETLKTNENGITEK